MIDKLNKLRENSSEEGFTLVELMIVVVIIAILAAISIPIYANQQKAAALSSVKTDTRNAASVVTTWMTENGNMPPTSCAEVKDFAELVTLSEGNELKYGISSTDPFSYYIRVAPSSSAYVNSYTGEALDEYKVFFISDIGKLFSSKTELASYLSSEKGLTIGEWLTEESYTFSTIVDGEIISGCGVDTE